jgi:hypothetical protein
MNDTGNTIDPATAAAPDDMAPTRQCGRCRLRFPVPTGTDPMELRDWWACPNCSEALLPGRQRTPKVEQHGGPT